MDSSKLLAFLGETIAAGALVYIGEPQMETSTIGPKLPIVKTSWPIVPLRVPLDTTVKDITDTIPVSIPAYAGEQRCFIVHNKQIEIHNFSLAYQDCSCKGKFCDRAVPLKKDIACGCMATGYTMNPMVADCTVTMLYIRCKYLVR